MRGIGPHADWIVFGEGRTFEVGDEGRDVLRIGVEVPADATAGLLVDLVLEVVAQEADNMTGLQLLRITVDPHADSTDVTLDQGDAAKKSPGPVLAWLVVAALMAAAMRRRQD